MCELFAISSSLPTEVSFSLDEFSKHGGLTDLHKDGWGIAHYDDNDARIVKETCSASESAYLHFVKDHSIRSHIIISHIRLATHGEVSIRNTQPFSRELGGNAHVFSHNGELSGLEDIPGYHLKRFQTIGNTDSEKAFCYLMEKMAVVWDQKNPPDLAQRREVIEQFANEIRNCGIANFIYSDSDYIFIHSHKRRCLKDNKTILPGLYTLCRSCPASNPSKSISGLQLTNKNSKNVVLAASVPLTGENWLALEEGEIRILRGGHLVTDI